FSTPRMIEQRAQVFEDRLNGGFRESLLDEIRNECLHSIMFNRIERYRTEYRSDVHFEIVLIGSCSGFGDGALQINRLDNVFLISFEARHGWLGFFALVLDLGDIELARSDRLQHGLLRIDRVGLINAFLRRALAGMPDEDVPIVTLFSDGAAHAFSLW